MPRVHACGVGVVESKHVYRMRLSCSAAGCCGAGMDRCMDVGSGQEGGGLLLGRFGPFDSNLGG